MIEQLVDLEKLLGEKQDEERKTILIQSKNRLIQWNRDLRPTFLPELSVLRHREILRTTLLLKRLDLKLLVLQLSIRALVVSDFYSNLDYFF